MTARCRTNRMSLPGSKKLDHPSIEVTVLTSHFDLNARSHRIGHSVCFFRYVLWFHIRMKTLSSTLTTASRFFISTESRCMSNMLWPLTHTYSHVRLQFQSEAHFRSRRKCQPYFVLFARAKLLWVFETSAQSTQVQYLFLNSVDAECTFVTSVGG